MEGRNESDAELLAALEGALAADENQHALRLHLAQLYLERDAPAAALAHASRVLAVQPAHREALALAAAAAAGAGQTEAATGYRELLAALDGTPGPAGGGARRNVGRALRRAPGRRSSTRRGAEGFVVRKTTSRGQAAVPPRCPGCSSRSAIQTLMTD